MRHSGKYRSIRGKSVIDIPFLRSCTTSSMPSLLVDARVKLFDEYALQGTVRRLSIEVLSSLVAPFRSSLPIPPRAYGVARRGGDRFVTATRAAAFSLVRALDPVEPERKFSMEARIRIPVRG